LVAADVFEPVVVLSEPICPGLVVSAWVLLPGVVFPVELTGGWGLPIEGAAGGSGVVGAVAGLLVPGAGADAPVPEPVVCAYPEPITSVVIPAIASGVNHR
jgi:hypothetical protein